MAIILDGRKMANEVKSQIKREIEILAKEGTVPGLAVVLVGSDPASEIYVNNKAKACSEMGIYSEQYVLSDDAQEFEILNIIKKLNDRKDIHGILVQLPLPKQMDENRVIELISRNKDVDVFHPCNVGKVLIGQYTIAPCTPEGILYMIKSTGVNIEGKECVVVGSSNIVGKPMAMLMLNNGATVTMCHIKTQNLKMHCKKADILIVAVGKEKLITADMIKPGAIVIDVGMNRDKCGNLCGDVDYNPVSEIAGYITPVPGGVGPMTIAMLLKNTIFLAQNSRS